MCALRARVRDLKNNQPTADPLSPIPQSGKGRGESDGGDIEPCILYPASSSRFPNPCLQIQGKGFGNQGAVSLPIVVG